MARIEFGTVVEFQSRRNGRTVRGVVTSKRWKNSRKVAPHFVCEVSPLKAGTGRRGKDVVWTVPELMLTVVEGAEDDRLAKQEALERTNQIKQHNVRVKNEDVREGLERIEELGLKVGMRVRILGRGRNWNATIGALNMRTGKVGLKRPGTPDSNDPIMAEVQQLMGGRKRRREFRWIHPRSILRVEPSNPR